MRYESTSVLARSANLAEVQDLISLLGQKAEDDFAQVASNTPRAGGAPATRSCCLSTCRIYRRDILGVCCSFHRHGREEAVEREPTSAERLALSTAAYHVYREIMPRLGVEGRVGTEPRIARGRARSQQRSCDLFFDPKAGTYKQLQPIDILFGVFQRGATVMRTSYGEFNGLVIRRPDMREAIKIFRRAGIAFSHPADAAKP